MTDLILVIVQHLPKHPWILCFVLNTRQYTPGLCIQTSFVLYILIQYSMKSPKFKLGLFCRSQFKQKAWKTLKKKDQTIRNQFFFWLECSSCFRGLWENQIGKYCLDFKPCWLSLHPNSVLLLLDNLLALFVLVWFPLPSQITWTQTTVLGFQLLNQRVYLGWLTENCSI